MLFSLPFLLVLERPAGDKHSSLLRTLINYGREKFYSIGACGLYYDNSMIVIYDCNDSGQYHKTTITIVYFS